MDLPALTPRRTFWLGITLLAAWLLFTARLAHYDDKNPPLQQRIQNYFNLLSSTLLTPLSAPAYYAQTGITHILHTPSVPANSTLEAVREENFQLTNQILLLTNHVTELERQIDDFTHVANTYHIRGDHLKWATIKNTTISPVSQICIIDKGTADNIAPGMVVLSRMAPLGRVIAVARNAAQIRLLTDPATKLTTKVVRVTDTGTYVISEDALVTGDGDNQLRCDSIKLNALEPKPGDLFLLQDPDWPTGIQGGAVGQVLSVDHSDSILRYTLKITPRVTVNRTSQVMVLIPETH